MEQTNNYPSWAKVAEVELVYRTTVKASERPCITSSQEGALLLKSLWTPDTIELHEAFKVLLLNRANKVLGVYVAASGGLTATVADPRLILAAALKALAVSLILCHNHPSGSLKPSTADEELTRKIKAAATYHDIKVLDHIILSSDSYFSFADEGLL